MRLLPILNYHHVGFRVEPAGHRRLWVSTERFSQHLGYLAHEGYRCLTLHDCYRYLSGGDSLPQRTVVLTFDDGYCNFMTHAYPILKQHDFSATLAVVTGEIGGRSRWDHGWESPLMGWEDILALSHAGIEIASHTVSHPHLTRLPLRLIQQELEGSRCALEKRLGTPVTTILYPYGDANSAVEEAAKRAGYHLACSNVSGNRHHLSHLFRLKRVPIDNFVTIDRLRRRLSPLYDYSCVLQRLFRRIKVSSRRDVRHKLRDIG